MTVTVNTSWYVNFGNGSSTGYFAVTQWATGAAKTVGQIVRQLATPAANSQRCFICIVAGTTHATTEPTWTVTKGAKTTDNTVTWMECTGLPFAAGDLTNTPLSSANRSGAQVLGNVIKNNAGTFLFICTTAGTTGAGEPTFSTTTGVTTADSGCTWTCIGAPGGFSNWAAPHCKFQNASASGWAVSSASIGTGDTIYVSSAHNETAASAVSAGAGYKYICIANAGSFPPGSGDVTTGAVVATTGANNITVSTVSTQGMIKGISFTAGTAGSLASIAMFTGASQTMRLEDCTFTLNGTSSISTVSIGSDYGEVEMVNVKFVLSTGAFAGINLNGVIIWRDTGSGAIACVGTPGAPAFCASLIGNTRIIDVDMSGWTGGTAVRLFTGNGGLAAGILQMLRCKMASGIALTNVGSLSGQHYEMVNCDSGGTIIRHEVWRGSGTQVSDTTVARTAGASDGTTSYSWKIGTQVNVTGPLGPSWHTPFKTSLLSVWNSTTGSNVTVTVEAAFNGAALPNNDEVWFDVNSYLGTAGSTLGSSASGTKANILSTATAWTASTQAWDSVGTARANSTAYAIGDTLKVASNSGRIFVCTAAGTSAGSEPGGYASAVDGGSVTDGGATFRAAMRCKLAVTLSAPKPAIAGPLYAQVKIGKANPTTSNLPIVWIDPYLTLS